jgi:hypothetical protein
MAAMDSEAGVIAVMWALGSWCPSCCVCEGGCSGSCEMDCSTVILHNITSFLACRLKILPPMHSLERFI